MLRLRRTTFTAVRHRRWIHSETNDRRQKIPLNSVVKVSATTTAPNFFLPWQKKISREGTGSGFVLKTGFGNCLITNAHVVADASYVFVRKALSPLPHRAKVVAVSHEADLALLEVADRVFWEGNSKGEAPVVGLELGPLPQLQDHVNVIGFPAGGEGVSVTRGVVSRIEPIQYAHTSIHLLGVQIDAAINPGNSGGPVLIEGPGDVPDLVAGVAFQCLQGADNIGYIIPAPVITHFLTQYQLHKKYTGFPQMGIGWQHLENQSLRSFFGLDPQTTGVIINKISPVAPAYSTLKHLDILMSIEGHKIANNGTIHFRGGERVFFNYLFVHKFVGETCSCQIRRGTEVLDTTFELISSYDLSLVPARISGNKPCYLVIGSLVFTRLTIPYLQEFSSEDDGSWVDLAPRPLVHAATYEMKESTDQEVVILSQILADQSTATYSNMSNLRLISFNGTKVQNMKHLSQLFHSATDPFFRFDFVDNLIIVLKKSEIAKATQRVMEEYSISAPMSQDLRSPSTKIKKPTSRPK